MILCPDSSLFFLARAMATVVATRKQHLSRLSEPAWTLLFQTCTRGQNARSCLWPDCIRLFLSNLRASTPDSLIRAEILFYRAVNSQWSALRKRRKTFLLDTGIARIGLMSLRGRKVNDLAVALINAVMTVENILCENYITFAFICLIPHSTLHGVSILFPFIHPVSYLLHQNPSTTTIF